MAVTTAVFFTEISHCIYSM